MEAPDLTVQGPENGPSRLEGLTDALHTERRLLDQMARVLRRQREGISTDDLAVLDESVYSAQRVLLTLQQARRRRRTLMTLLGGAEDTPLGELEAALGPSVSPSLSTARDQLVEAAERLGRELEVNRRVIDGAISVGDELIALFMGPPPSPELYSKNNGPEPGGRPGALINTSA